MKRLERNEGAATSPLWGVTETLQRQQALCPLIIYLAVELIKDLSFFSKNVGSSDTKHLEKGSLVASTVTLLMTCLVIPYSWPNPLCPFNLGPLHWLFPLVSMPFPGFHSLPSEIRALDLLRTLATWIYIIGNISRVLNDDNFYILF